MKLVNRKFVVLAAVTAVAGSALAMPTFASAKTYKVTCKVVGTDPTSVTSIAGKITCPKPFGKGKQTGTLKIPISKGKWTFKGCSWTIKSDPKRLSKIDGRSVSGGVNLISKGTGKCKGAKGSASFSGDLVSAKYTYKVTVKF